MSSNELEILKRALEDLFMSRKIKNKVVAAAESYPDVKSVFITYRELEGQDPRSTLVNTLIDAPALFFYYAGSAAAAVLPPDVQDVPLNIRIIDIPDDIGLRRAIRNLTSRDVGRLITVDGLVRRVSETRPMLTRAVFLCERCGSLTVVDQAGPYLEEPLACDQENGGCGSAGGRTRFTLLTERDPARTKGYPLLLSIPLSEFEDTQVIEVQELHEDLKGGQEPGRLPGILKADLINTIMPGNRVSLTGILRSRQKGKVSTKSNFFNFYLDVMAIHVAETEYEEIIITPEDEEKILALSKTPDLREKLIYSIAPDIYGMQDTKEAILLQLFGGVPKVGRSGTKIRGDIHLFIIGDPGIAKSQLLAYVAQLAPRSVFASGKASTTAGLTAAAVKESGDLTGDGRWILEAGALVLADKGIACVDEFDKMSEKDRDSMHHAMEQQCLHINKAGISATLQTRCSVLAAANPKLGRWDPHKDRPAQIEIDPPLLSRFDIIFILEDKIDRKMDRAIATHIVETHFIGEVEKAEAKERTTKEAHIKKIAEIEARRGNPLDKAFFRKYIAYAKKNIFPAMTAAVMDAPIDHYVAMRQSTQGSTIPMTPRNIEALIRLAEASAKMRLCPHIEEEDYNTAIRVVQRFLQSAATNEYGMIDVDIISTGFGKSQRDRIWTLLDIIKDMQDTGGSAALEDIYRVAEERGLPRNRIKTDIERLKKDGQIFEFNKDQYKIS